MTTKKRWFLVYVLGCYVGAIAWHVITYRGDFGSLDIRSVLYVLAAPVSAPVFLALLAYTFVAYGLVSPDSPPLFQAMGVFLASLGVAYVAIRIVEMRGFRRKR